MNDDNIMACILFAQKEGLACADEALKEYKAILKKVCPTKRAADGFKRGAKNVEKGEWVRLADSVFPKRRR